MPTINEISISDAEFTAMQEKAAAFILERVFKDKKTFNNEFDILEDSVTKAGLVKLFTYNNKKLFLFNMPTKSKGMTTPDYQKVVKQWLKTPEGKWANTFFLQQDKMKKIYPNAKFDKFNREGGFMHFISELVRTKFGISKKDSWDPADIWLIRGDEKAIENKIKKQLEGPKSTQTILELNSILRKMFVDKEVVGISLKLISGKEAQWQEVNVDEKFFKKLETYADGYNYSLSKVTMKMGLKPRTSEFQTQDTVLFLKAGSTDVLKFQIKGNSTSDYANLKIEGSLISAGSARLGKAPLGLVEKLSGTVDKSLFSAETRKFQNYAMTVEDFLKDYDRYKDQAKILLDNKIYVKELGFKTLAEFKENMIKAFNSKNNKHHANNKLQQMYLITKILSLKEKVRDEYLTDLAFLAQKMGRKVTEFGPFGKLY
jgi:hypothetical protein